MDRLIREIFLLLAARVYGYLLQWKYFGTSWDALSLAHASAYDEETAIQRANEAVGLRILEDSFTRSLRIVMVRALTRWEFLKSIYEVKVGVALLQGSGWNADRINRFLDTVRVKVLDENKQ